MQNAKRKMQKEAEYIESFSRAAKDPENIALAEEGMEDYLELLDEPLSNSLDLEIMTY